jgi:hypothetical protein
MQDRIRVKKIVRGIVKGATVVKDALNVDWLIEQAKAQVKRQRKNKKNQERSRK